MKLEGTGAYGPLLLAPLEGIQGSLWAAKYSTVQYNTVQYSTVQYSTVQYSTVQYSIVHYSTVTGVGDGVRGWLTPYSTLCGAIVTGAACLVAECGTDILLKKCQKITFLKPLFGAL